jgi:hypothetical protein
MMVIKVRVVVTNITRKMRFRISPAAIRFEGVDRFLDLKRDVGIAPGPKPYTDPRDVRPFHNEPTPGIGVETSSVRVRFLE